MDNANPLANVGEEDDEEVLPVLESSEAEDLRYELFDYIREIQDPEHSYTLEKLQVVREGLVDVRGDDEKGYDVVIRFKPTVAHCSLASTIGLCIRHKVNQNFQHVRYKLTLKCVEGTHDTEDDINKQVNDKERIAAALENPMLLETVERLNSALVSTY